jgi:hypothetical protein
MMKFYAKKSLNLEQPKQEIIQYLLNYSKQLRVVKTNHKHNIELHLN